jgi:hypothetical protein
MAASETVATWFETALARLLTMRGEGVSCDKFNTTGKSLLLVRNHVNPKIKNISSSHFWKSEV